MHRMFGVGGGFDDGLAASAFGDGCTGRKQY